MTALPERIWTRASCLFLMGVVFALSNSPEAFAAEQISGWRPTYDLVMKWVNFTILIFIVVKFLRTPIKEFLTGQKDMIANDISRLEQKKQSVIEQIHQAQGQLVDSDRRLTELKERMVQQGEREKEKIIESARQQSHFMMETAQRKVAHRIQQAKANFRAELIDMAVNAAMSELPSLLTEADNQALVQQFLEQTGEKPPQ